MKERANVLKEKLSPLEYYVTQGMGHERPYTGDLWWTKDVGMYSCKCCT
jgi:peptide methionine sulfoxide reductase MsrB